jgi:hypothetical protein
MKLIADLFSHLFLYGLITAVAVFVLFMILGALGFVGQFLFVIFYPLYGITLKPVIWGIKSIFETRCPKCKGFFKKKNVGFEVTDEQEVLRTINRADQGVLYSNDIFALDQGIEINRQEQVNFVEQDITKTWECKNPLCGHQWQTEEFTEWEGSLEK